MKNNEVNIETKDCLAFKQKEATADVLQKFIQSQQSNIFKFGAEGKNDESKLAEYDFVKHTWLAGRFVGEASFDHNNTKYKLTIKPRFGESFLLHMLEEIYNIRITTSTGNQKKTKDWQHFIKRIIAIIWTQKLATANLHGVPKIQSQKTYRGATVKGRVSIRQSVLPYKTTNEIISVYYEKRIDDSIARIILEAYNVLKAEFGLGNLKLPDSAQDALNSVFKIKPTKRRITFYDYEKIKYKEIYKSWKHVVDLSWDIIKHKQLSLKQSNNQKGLGFFIDMAEVWEQYLRSILKKHLVPLGWHSINEKQLAYRGYFFQRQLIPDLLFQKGEEIAVWDAKYKRMKGNNYDVDRADFFQIHTYIMYQLNYKTVRSGGLLYPISTDITTDKFQSPYLIHEEGLRLIFQIDGVQLSEIGENENHDKFEAAFIDRIIQSLL